MRHIPNGPNQQGLFCPTNVLCLEIYRQDWQAILYYTNMSKGVQILAHYQTEFGEHKQSLLLTAGW